MAGGAASSSSPAGAATSGEGYSLSSSGPKLGSGVSSDGGTSDVSPGSNGTMKPGCGSTLIGSLTSTSPATNCCCSASASGLGFWTTSQTCGSAAGCVW